MHVGLQIRTEGKVPRGRKERRRKAS
jgi:hypothetical protein